MNFEALGWDDDSLLLTGELKILDFDLGGPSSAHAFGAGSAEMG